MEKIIDKLILELSGKENMEKAKKYFEAIRHSKYKKSEKLFLIININQLAVLFRIKKELKEAKR